MFTVHMQAVFNGDDFEDAVEFANNYSNLIMDTGFDTGECDEVLVSISDGDLTVAPVLVERSDAQYLVEKYRDEFLKSGDPEAEADANRVEAMLR